MAPSHTAAPASALLVPLSALPSAFDYETALVGAVVDPFPSNATAPAGAGADVDSRPASVELFVYGFCLILIPTATIFGNLLVIVSVLRFKVLHSAINFFILGLAVADLFVALFVMPYAVYVYIEGGYWYLGELMCDIYSASDVACSTASILLLAVISFDRYRAVSQPIKYSRQSRNIKRVVGILLAIWFFSLALASPIVLGVNNRPPDASPLECRFYNPLFSIVSSVGSFVIPCFFILFIYTRIMLALRKRERAARARRLANGVKDKEKSVAKGAADRKADGGTATGGTDSGEVGEMVAAPAVNMMLMALPSMSRRMRRFERHRAAIDHAGGGFCDGLSGGDGRPSGSPFLGVLAPSAAADRSTSPLAVAAASAPASPSAGRLTGLSRMVKAVAGHENYLYEDDEDDEELDDFFDEEDEDEFESDEDEAPMIGRSVGRPLANIHSMMQTMANASNYRSLLSRGGTARRRSSQRRKRAKTSITSSTAGAPCREIIVDRTALLPPFRTEKRQSTTAQLMGSALSTLLAGMGGIPRGSNDSAEIKAGCGQDGTENDEKAMETVDAMECLQNRSGITIDDHGYNEHDLMLSSSPCSSIDSLSDCMNVVTNDFVSEAATNPSSCRRSSEEDEWPVHRHYRALGAADSSEMKASVRRTHFERLKRSVRKRARRAFAASGGGAGSPNGSRAPFPQSSRVRPVVPPECILPSIFRRFSRRGPLFFRGSLAGTLGIWNRGAHQAETDTADGSVHRRGSGSRHKRSVADGGAVVGVRPAVFRAYGCGRHGTTGGQRNAKCIANSLALEQEHERLSPRDSSANGQCAAAALRHANGRRRVARAISGGGRRVNLTDGHQPSPAATVFSNSATASPGDETARAAGAAFSPLLEEEFVDECDGSRTPLIARRQPTYNGPVAPLAENEKDSPLVTFKFAAGKSVPSIATTSHPPAPRSPLRRGSSAMEFSSDCVTKNSMETSTTGIRSSVSSNIFSVVDTSCTRPLLENHNSDPSTKSTTVLFNRNADRCPAHQPQAGHSNNHARLGQHHYYSVHGGAVMTPARRSVDSITAVAATVAPTQQAKSAGPLDCRHHRFFGRNHSSGRLECGCVAYATLSAPSGTAAVAKTNGSAGGASSAATARALAVKMVKKTVNRKESSLKRKVTKSQRKEKRATKTLGIVVGIFLICWVPFFTINILNAVCVTIGVRACEVGFAPFFYATWIGYMNSFMNPIIYTIFNTEFRRAFKSLILGRNAVKRSANNNRERKI